MDIWRETHPNIKQYTWHSAHKPLNFSRLDYFLISENVRNSISSSKHSNCYKSDHCIVSITFDLTQHSRGQGYFKINNDLLLDPDYQEIIRENINEITTINAEANPNTLWDLIKGTVRNETIKYASRKKKETNKTEDKLNDDITKLKKDMSEACKFVIIEIIKSDLERKINELESILENKINGSILR